MTDDPQDDDLVAAEYVLGTLDPVERLAAAGRLDTDPVFARLVEAWTDRLAPLGETGRSAEPPSDLWTRLVDRLGWTGNAATTATATIIHLEHRLRRWRLLTLASAAMAACLAGITAVTVAQRGDDPRPLVALLQQSDAPPSYLVRADLGHRSLNLRPLAATPPAGSAYELWIIDPLLGAPRSLGVLSGGDTVAARPLPSDVSRDVAARATYAITVEPPGGSPTGKPSGTPVFVGHLFAT